MEQLGARILVARGDVAREDDVMRIMNELGSSMPPLHGVVHAAGILDDALLLKETWKHFSRVLAPKVIGAWNLHMATRHSPLDFFVLFSSTAALLPNHGQCSYATANAFLDMLAHHRHAQGLPALSINWGIWSGGGMAASVGDRERERWSQQGVTLMEPVDALKTLEQVLAEECSQVAIIPVDWSVFFRFQKGAHVQAMLSELAGRTTKLSRMVEKTPETPNLRQRLNDAAPNRRLAVLSEYVIEAAAAILKLDDLRVLSTRKPLREAGLDSLMAVQLRDILSLAVGRNLPATLVFKYSTIDALTHYLAMDILSIGATTEEGAAIGEADETQQVLQELESLSEQEVKDLLAEELKSLPEELRKE